MHCSGLVVDLEKHLPAGQFTSLDDKLKTKGSWLNSWSEDQNLVVSLDDKLNRFRQQKRSPARELISCTGATMTSSVIWRSIYPQCSSLPWVFTLSGSHVPAEQPPHKQIHSVSGLVSTVRILPLPPQQCSSSPTDT
jgi:hypothetical protein